MEAEKTPISELLMQTLRSPGNMELFRELESRMGEFTDSILEDLENNGGLEDACKIGENWAVQVFGLISEKFEIPLAPEDKVLIELQLEKRAKEEAYLGKMFLVLRNDLPERLRSVREYFSFLPTVEPGYALALLKQPDARAAEPFAASLAVKGISPLTIFYAIEGIRLLFERYIHHGYLDPESVTITDATLHPPEKAKAKELGSFLCVAGIQSMTEQNEAIAKALYAWIFEVARFKPYIFKGFRVIRNADDQPIMRRCETIWKLEARWSATTAVPEKQPFHELLAETLLKPDDHESLEELRSRKAEVTQNVTPGKSLSIADVLEQCPTLAVTFGDLLPNKWLLTVFSAILPPTEAEEMSREFVAHFSS